MNNFFTTLSFVLFLSCNSSSPKPKEIVRSKNPEGIGIQQLDLAPINDSVMKLGANLFNEKCSMCHTMEYKNIGPDVSDLLAYRKKEWLVNFLLNKDEMILRDSLTQINIQKYDTICGANISKREEAMQLLEYFRIYQIWLHEFNAL